MPRQHSSLLLANRKATAWLPVKNCSNCSMVLRSFMFIIVFIRLLWTRFMRLSDSFSVRNTALLQIHLSLEEALGWVAVDHEVQSWRDSYFMDKKARKYCYPRAYAWFGIVSYPNESVWYIRISSAVTTDKHKNENTTMALNFILNSYFWWY